MTLTIKEIAKQLGLSVTEARTAVAGLQSKGFLEKPAAKKDSQFELTDKGRTIGRAIGFDL